MEKLTEKEMRELEARGNKIVIDEPDYNMRFNFYYIYQGDACEAIFCENTFLMYIDIDEELENIKTREDEKEAIKKQIKGFMEEVDFMYEIYKMEYNYGY